MWLPDINPNLKKALKELHVTRSSLWSKIGATIKIWKERGDIRRKWRKSCAEERKELRHVMKDLYSLIWRYNRTENFLVYHYFTSSCFRKNYDIKDTVMWSEWYSALVIYSYSHLDLMKRLYNKASAKKIFAKAGIPIPVTFGVARVVDGKVLCENSSGQMEDFATILRENKSLFMKPEDASFGDSCMKVDVSQAFCRINGQDCTEGELIDKMGENMFIVEKYIENHPVLKAFHPQSLNTVRIITMQTPNENLEIARAALRMGIGNMAVDNLSAGGIAVAISKDGTLNSTAEANDWRVPSCKLHPDSLIRFEGVAVPYYKESVNLCIKAHETCCPELFCVGWDIAITPDGPILLEANPHSGVIQSPCGGIRRVYENWLKPLAINRAYSR